MISIRKSCILAMVHLPGHFSSWRNCCLMYIELVRTVGMYSWYIQLVRTVGMYSWYLQLVRTVGMYSWYLELVRTVGMYSWYLQLVRTVGMYSWYIQLILTVQYRPSVLSSRLWTFIRNTKVQVGCVLVFGFDFSIASHHSTIAQCFNVTAYCRIQ